MTIALEILARIRGTLSQSGDGGTASLPLNVSNVLSIANGTAADQANAVYVDAFSISASGWLNIDLAGGGLTDRLGNALNFTALKAILLIADSTNTNNVVLGNGTNPFVGPFGAGANTLTVEPGGTVLLATRSAAGWAVAAGSADVLKLANSGGGSAVTGTIVLVGEA
ncbi:MAG: hypothetical protein ACOY7T_12425 [Pseudomonadota bacterium]